jgi:hypothetical protein
MLDLMSIVIRLARCVRAPEYTVSRYVSPKCEITGEQWPSDESHRLPELREHAIGIVIRMSS